MIFPASNKRSISSLKISSILFGSFKGLDPVTLILVVVIGFVYCSNKLIKNVRVEEVFDDVSEQEHINKVSLIKFSPFIAFGPRQSQIFAATYFEYET